MFRTGKEADKVFCNECKYLLEIFLEDCHSNYFCKAPIDRLKTVVIADTWLQKGSETTIYKEQKPHDLNKNNDCSYFSSLGKEKRRILYQ